MSEEDIEDLLNYKIKCFQHCIKTKRLLCFKIPEKCPTCMQLLNTSYTTFLIPPFVLPTPLTITRNEEDGSKASLPPYSLLLQPTNGNYESFLAIINHKQTTTSLLNNDFGDLHIGITNSKAEIFDFDMNGLNRNSLKWFKIPSIVIKLNHHYESSESMTTCCVNDDNLKFLFYNYYYLNFNKWDFILDNYWYNQRHTKWSSKSYNEMKFNCLDFVIQFLIDYDYKFQNFNSSSTESMESLKYLVSNQLIEPEFIKCFKYLNLLAKIKTNEYFIENISCNNTASTSSIEESKEDEDVSLKINETTSMVTISTRM